MPRAKLQAAGWGALLTGFVVPGQTFAASGQFQPLDVSVFSVIPFVALLLAIAILPLAAPHFWHSNRNRAVVSFALGLPAVVYLYLYDPRPDSEAIRVLGRILEEYVAFILLLGSLYTVCGGVVLRGDLRGTPLTNTAILGLGAILSNLVGTTGASMLLIRPVLRANRGRRYVAHVPIFFIFTVSNTGGLLTPLGDPPLFLGFLRGVDFFWTLRLWPQWLLVNGLVLLIFLVWDWWAFRREGPSLSPPEDVASGSMRLEGWVNFVLLAGILVGVLLQSKAVSDSATAFLGQFFPCPSLQLSPLGGAGVMLAMAVLSLLLTPRGLRRANAFTWGPIVEVAVIFAGLFATMGPALELLMWHGPSLGLSQAWQFFWLTGLLSSFLDNAPTYLAFVTAAASPGVVADLMHTKPLILQAISCGAVFMGANTYIGNGPNFMVKAIADEAGFKTPSFFGYMLCSGLILLPIFVLVTALFFPW